MKVTIHKTNPFCLLLLFVLFLIPKAIGQEQVFVYKQGVIDFQTGISDIDSVKIDDSHTPRLRFYRADNVVYDESVSQVDSITFSDEKPLADILDVAFHNDGTASDRSPLKNEVTTVQSDALSTYFHPVYRCMTARFENAYGSAPSAYYRIDYRNSQTIKNALLDGHTLEALVMTSQPDPLPDKESKPFSAHESGGTGLMVTTISGSRQNELTFLVHVNGAYRWATSGVVPEPGVYYHVVGVWNKEEGKASVYVNGELKNTIEADGNMTLPSKVDAQWFGIGGDAGASAAQTGWKGDVVLARIYDAPLTRAEVDLLWGEIKELGEKAEEPLVRNISYFSGVSVVSGNLYPVYGEGFEADDRLVFSPISDSSGEDVTVQFALQDDGIRVTIPDGLQSGQYRILLIRGDRTQDLGIARLYVVDALPKAFEVIAHRGYWDTPGSAQNSIASLRKAQDLGVYGSEFDVWITTDGQVVVNHDETINGVAIQHATFDQIKELTLSNGETIPTLESYLQQGKADPHTKLIIEIKTHYSSLRNKAIAKACVEMVDAMGLNDQVEYIAFHLDICKEILSLQPNSTVAYLNGDKAPQVLFEAGIKGIDYKLSVLQSNPEWIKEAQDLGMTVNVWTVNSVADILEMANLGVDFISTDNPEEAKKIRNLYLK